MPILMRLSAYLILVLALVDVLVPDLHTGTSNCFAELRRAYTKQVRNLVGN